MSKEEIEKQAKALRESVHRRSLDLEQIKDRLYKYGYKIKKTSTVPNQLEVDMAWLIKQVDHLQQGLKLGK